MVSILGSSYAYAHNMRSISIEITESSSSVSNASHYKMLLRKTVTDDQLIVTTPCAIENSTKLSIAHELLILNCDQKLEIKDIQIAGIGPLITEAFVKITYLEGQAVTALHLKDTSVSGGSKNSIFVKFNRLGFLHVLRGWDHLLFLAGLTLICWRMKQVFVLASVFTLAHGSSLTLVALGYGSGLAKISEIAIAMTILYMAKAIVDHQKDGIKLVNMFGPVFIFGLIHGMGFANALGEIGIPDDQLIVSLLSFNFGVEISQLLFIVLLFNLLKLIPSQNDFKIDPKLVLSYGIGSLGAYIFIDRLNEVLIHGL
jgi:hypothetical protein